LHKYLTICFILCTSTVQAQTLQKVLFSTIVSSYSVNALQDAIAFTKSPKGQDLKYLWHGAKYVHIGTAVAVGVLNVLCIQKYGWKKTLLIDAAGFILGTLVWRYTYPKWRKVDWPDWV